MVSTRFAPGRRLRAHLVWVDHGFRPALIRTEQRVDIGEQSCVTDEPKDPSLDAHQEVESAGRGDALGRHVAEDPLVAGVDACCIMANDRRQRPCRKLLEGRIDGAGGCPPCLLWREILLVVEIDDQSSLQGVGRRSDRMSGGRRGRRG